MSDFFRKLALVPLGPLPPSTGPGRSGTLTVGLSGLVGLVGSTLTVGLSGLVGLVGSRMTVGLSGLVGLVGSPLTVGFSGLPGLLGLVGSTGRGSEISGILDLGIFRGLSFPES